MTELRLEVSSDHNPAATPDAAGQYRVDIIRKRLDAEAVYPSNYRYNPTTDDFEFFRVSDGAWVPSPESDPRTFSRLPPLTGPTRQCDSAASAVARLKANIDLMIGMADAGAALVAAGSTIIAAVAALLSWSGWPVLIALAVDTFAIVTAAGAAAVEAAFTSGVYDTLSCILYCHMDADGVLSADALAVVNADIDDLIGGTAAAVLHGLFGLIGPGGISGYGALGGTAGDCSGCSACDWCMEMNFATGQHGWSPVLAWDGSPRATWAGAYFAPITVSGSRQMFIWVTFPTDCIITEVTISGTAWTQPPTSGEFGNHESGQFIAITPIPINAYTRVFAGISMHMAAGDRFRINNVRTPNTTGDWAFTKVKFKGTGGNPFGVDNC